MKLLEVDDRSMTLDEAFGQAVTMYGAGDRAGSKSLLDRVVALDPQHAPALNALGIIALDGKDIETAYFFVSRALESDPAMDKAYNTMVAILLQRGNPGAAEETARRAIAINPLFAEAHGNLGRVLLAEGRAGEAAESFRQAVELRPEFWQFRYHVGMALEQAGRFVEAETAYGETERHAPAFPDLFVNLGNCRVKCGDLGGAEAAYRQALLIAPPHPRALNNLGNILSETGRLEEAEACYRQATELDPGYTDAFVHLGQVLYDRDRHEEAVAVFRHCIDLAPTHVPAIIGISNPLRRMKRFAEAEQHLLEAITLAPDSHTAHNNLGSLYVDLGHYAQAEELLAKARELAPAATEVYANLGYLRLCQRLFDEAEEYLRHALVLRADLPHALCNLGVVYKQTGRLDQALASYRDAVAADPLFCEAWTNMAPVLADMGRLHEALDALSMIPSGRETCESLTNLGYVLGHLGRTDEALAALRRALVLDPEALSARSNMLMTMLYSSSCSAADIYAESRTWDTRSGNRPASPPQRVATVSRRLRIGYISPDLRTHSVAFFFAPLLQAHDRQNVEVFCYSDVARPDAMTQRLRSFADTWRNVLGSTDEELFDTIRRDGIDILVDLAGHTAGNRLRLFTMKPAPVQVSWLGYPATTGLSAIDFRITDAIADPAGEADLFHAEQLYRLPEGFLCYSAPSDYPPVALSPCAHNGYVTFGSFNKPSKISGEVLDAWGEILKRVPDSRLLLKSSVFCEERTCEEFLARFEATGIPSSRVTLAPYIVSTAGHLDAYGRVDISLDTFPYNGTTTTCESLFMGVPVVTLLGASHVARVGGSILSGIGRQEWIAPTSEEYIATAVRLAATPERLKAIRSDLRHVFQKSPLFDAAGFARRMETAYRTMWQKYSAQGS